MSDQIPTELEPQAVPDLGPPPSNNQMSNGLFAALIVVSIVAVVALAYLFGRSLDNPSESAANAPRQAVPQAFPAPFPVPPPDFAPDAPPIPIPLPTPAPIPFDAAPLPPNAIVPLPFPGEFPPTPVAPPGGGAEQPTLSDHWHSVYGVYSCNQLGEGPEKYLPPFQSVQDDTGIHSHADGLIHIHPFVESAAGDNAVMRHWFAEMQVEVTPERISVQNGFDLPVELIAGEECADGTGPAEIVILRWQFDFMALADDGPPPEIFADGFDEIRFMNEREVYVIAYVSSTGTDLETLPLPPQPRFDSLNNVSSVLEG